MSLCPHGYTAFWDCPTCEEPMGTNPSLGNMDENVTVTCDRCGKEHECVRAALPAEHAPPEPDEFLTGWNPGWVKIWREHEAKHPTPPYAKTWEQAYRHLALAVNSMPDTCDEECNSHGHSIACGEKDAAWPAEEIVRLQMALAFAEGRLGSRPALAGRGTLTPTAIEAAARALWAMGNARIGERPWESVCAHYIAEATVALEAARSTA